MEIILKLLNNIINIKYKNNNNFSNKKVKIKKKLQ